MTKEIPLTQGKAALVDDEDFERVSQHRWHAVKISRRWYAAHSFRVSPGKQRQCYLHRFIMCYSAPEIDHVNGDGLDCRKENMRAATHGQNTKNRRPNHNSPHGTKGVITSNRKGNPYRAAIAGKHIGSFHTAEEAARAYDAKAKELFGEFARLNFPQS